MKFHALLRKVLLPLLVGVAVGAGGAIWAHSSGHDHVKVSQLSRRDMQEKLDGVNAAATVVEVTFEPGQKDSSHRHAGPVFGYVLEGEYEHAIDDQPTMVYKAGETFYEPSGCVHRVAANASKTKPTRLLAVVLHPRDVEDITVPDQDHK